MTVEDMEELLTQVVKDNEDYLIAHQQRLGSGFDGLWYELIQHRNELVQTALKRFLKSDELSDLFTLLYYGAGTIAACRTGVFPEWKGMATLTTSYKDALQVLESAGDSFRHAWGVLEGEAICIPKLRHSLFLLLGCVLYLIGQRIPTADTALALAKALHKAVILFEELETEKDSKAFYGELEGFRKIEKEADLSTAPYNVLKTAEHSADSAVG